MIYEPALLRARGVTKRFGAVLALADVDFDIRKGEIVALVGENGSGKSTLARILAGVIQPDDGAIELAGAECTLTSPRDALDRGIAIVTQELTAVPQLSVAENVVLPSLRSPAALVDQRRIVRRAEPFLRLVGLDIPPLQRFSTLPPGKRELVEIAKALASEPQILILDEATTRLPDAEHLFGLLERLCERGVAVIFITQRLREILRLAHRAVVLRDGRVAGEVAGHGLDEHRLTTLMVGRDLGGFFHKVDGVVSDAVVLEVDGVITDRSPVPVTIKVRAGEIVGLAGLVGSGRTELLETVAGVRPRHAGDVRVAGRLVRNGSVPAAIRAGIALVPEDRRQQGLVHGASVSENIAMAGWKALSLRRSRPERARALEAVRRLEIRCAGVDADVDTLSGGNQQKVVFARCISCAPRVLLLDEPTRGVDVGAREEIYRLVGQLVAGGTGVLVASSDLPELLGLADRIVVLHEGMVVGHLSRSEATEEQIVRLAAGGAASVL